MEKCVLDPGTNQHYIHINKDKSTITTIINKGYMSKSLVDVGTKDSLYLEKCRENQCKTYKIRLKCHKLINIKALVLSND